MNYDVGDVNANGGDVMTVGDFVDVAGDSCVGSFPAPASDDACEADEEPVVALVVPAEHFDSMNDDWTKKMV